MLHAILATARIDHIAIATPSIETYLRDLGYSPNQIPIETISEQEVRVGFITTTQGLLEIIEPTSETSSVARFLSKHNGSAMHHIGIAVSDIKDAIAQLKESGTTLIDETPRNGANNKLIAFIHPRSTGGILYELCQTK